MVLMIQESPLRMISLVRCQSPLAYWNVVVKNTLSQLTRTLPRGAYHGTLDSVVMLGVYVGENTILVFQATISSNRRVLDSRECSPPSLRIGYPSCQ